MDLTKLKETLSSDRTVAALAPIKTYLDTLLAPVLSGSENGSREAVAAMKECGDASRDDDWRVPIGEAGILELAADVLDRENAGIKLRIQALRICGNSCAEKDVNRQRSADRPNGLRAIVKATTNADLLVYAIPVLQNICLDHDAAQERAIKDGAGRAMFELLGRDGILDDDEDNALSAQMEHILMITETLAKHDSFKKDLDASSISVLLKLALSPKLEDLDHYASILTIIMNLLSDDKFQKYLITTMTVEKLLDILEDSYSKFKDDHDLDTARVLNQLRKTLIIAMSDVSSNPAFPDKYPIATSPFLKKLESWLSTAPATFPSEADRASYLLSEALQTSACIMLGNVATSDTACLTLVNNYNIHLPLISIMSEKSKDAGTVFSAVGMLRNLVLPENNKAVIGSPETGIWQALENRWLHAIEGGIEKQVPYAVSGLGRLLVKGCKDNAVRLLEDATTTEHIAEDGSKTATRLSILLQLWKKSDEIPTQTEIARTLCEVFRCIAAWKKSAGSGGAKEVAQVEERIFDRDRKYLYHERVVPVLTSMVKQDKWPVVRSEGLFALGLLCAGFGASHGASGIADLEKEGARQVWVAREEWWEVVTGERLKEGKIISEEEIGISKVKVEEEKEREEKKEKEKKQPLQGKDFANALVMIAEIKRRLEDELSEEDKQQLDQVLKRLTTKSEQLISG